MKNVDETAGAAVIEALAVVTFDFAKTKGVKLESLAKMERDWKATKGRIESAVKEQCEANASLTPVERKKAANKTVENALLQDVVTATPAQVGRLANELVKVGKLSQGDAAFWVAYVQLAAALGQCRTIGKV